MIGELKGAQMLKQDSERGQRNREGGGAGERCLEAKGMEIRGILLRILEEKRRGET